MASEQLLARSVLPSICRTYLLHELKKIIVKNASKLEPRSPSKPAEEASVGDRVPSDPSASDVVDTPRSLPGMPDELSSMLWRTMI